MLENAPPGGPFAGELLRKALRAAHMGVWQWHLASGAVRWSPQIERIFGLEPGTFEGTLEGFTSRVHPDDLQGIRTQIEQLVAGTKSEIRIRHRILRGDGQVRWIDGWGSVERDAGGNAVSVLGVTADATPRLREHDALQAIGERLGGTGRAFFEALVRALCDVLQVRFALAGELRPEGRIRSVAVWADGASQEPFEYALAGTPCAEVVARRLCAHPRDVRTHYPEHPLLAELKAEGFLGITLQDPQGQVLGVLVVVHDQPLEEVELCGRILLSFAVRAEAELQRLGTETELRETASRLRQAQHLARLGIWEWDVLSDRATWSDEMLAIYGITRDAFTGVGSDYLGCTHPEDRDLQEANIARSVERAAARAREEGRSVQMALEPVELRIVRPNGDVCYVRGDTLVVVDPDGQPQRMFGVLLDITEQKHMEQQLLQAQKLETVGRLAGGIAHDFNNLLTVTLAAAELALPEVEAGTGAYQLLEQIKATAVRGGELTSQLLSFARRQVLRLQELDLDAHLRAGAEGLLTRLIGEHIELRLDLRSGARVKADASQLDQVLLNLVVNAADAMPEGGTLTVATRVVGDEVLWRVRDTGPGIPAELHEQVFEPFFTTKGPGQGTGLGLSTCFGIVAQHGGRLELESEPGQGTTFMVWLPLFSTGAELEDPAEEDSPEGGEEVILLVEDEPRVRALAERCLSKLGYRVVTAPDGERALAVASSTPRLDLLLTDVIMPHVGGPELSTRLRERRPTVKTLFMSGYTDDLLHLDEGVELLRKPYTLAQLAERVRAVLDA